VKDAAYFDGGVSHDPAASAMIREVERENLQRRLAEDHLGAVRHFERRLRAIGLSPADWLIVVLNVDDARGAALAGVPMPGQDWSEIRARGETPFARGLASRRPLQEMLQEIDGDAARELQAIDGVAVLVFGLGVTAAFAASELS
jgi:hypothetical protein